MANREEIINLISNLNAGDEIEVVYRDVFDAAASDDAEISGARAGEAGLYLYCADGAVPVDKIVDVRVVAPANECPFKKGARVQHVSGKGPIGEVVGWAYYEAFGHWVVLVNDNERGTLACLADSIREVPEDGVNGFGMEFNIGEIVEYIDPACRVGDERLRVVGYQSGRGGGYVEVVDEFLADGDAWGITPESLRLAAEQTPLNCRVCGKAMEYRKDGEYVNGWGSSAGNVYVLVHADGVEGEHPATLMPVSDENEAAHGKHFLSCSIWAHNGGGDCDCKPKVTGAPCSICGEETVTLENGHVRHVKPDVSPVTHLASLPHDTSEVPIVPDPSSVQFKAGWDACLQAVMDQFGEDFTKGNPNPEWHLLEPGEEPTFVRHEYDGHNSCTRCGTKAYGNGASDECPGEPPVGDFPVGALVRFKGKALVHAVYQWWYDYEREQWRVLLTVGGGSFSASPNDLELVPTDSSDSTDDGQGKTCGVCGEPVWYVAHNLVHRVRGKDHAAVLPAVSPERVVYVDELGEELASLLRVSRRMRTNEPFRIAYQHLIEREPEPAVGTIFSSKNYPNMMWMRSSASGEDRWWGFNSATNQWMFRSWGELTPGHVVTPEDTREESE